MLDIEPGMRVYEVGTGSGWNAALIGALVGPRGSVESIEIVSELATRADRSLVRAGVSNVRVRCGDAGSRASEDESFDRVVFTAGAHDIPASVFGRVRRGGLLLMVLKCPGGGDMLVLFRRDGEVLVARESWACEFVPMIGGGHRPAHEPVAVEQIVGSLGLRGQAPFATPFSWGGRHTADFAERTFPIRSFLAATEPRFAAVADAGGAGAFALASARDGWLVVMRNGEALCYGRREGWEHVQRILRRWIDLGAPTMLSMGLRAYASGRAPTPDADEWLMRRQDTDFLWSLRWSD